MNFLRRLSVKRYYKYKDEVVKRNFIASETFLLIGTIVATVNMLSNIFIRKTNGYAGSLVLLIYFVVAAILRRFLIKNNNKRSTIFLYMVQIPVMIFGILMGTVLDKTSITITFFLLLICMPPFILDNPVRHLFYIISMMAIYLVLGYHFKSMDVFRLDAVHALSFLMGAMFVNLFVLAERFDNIENYVLSEQKARHDEMTGLKNRYALKLETDEYVGEMTYFGLVEVAYFKFLNDLYGHSFGEDVMKCLGQKAGELFDIDTCYRFESDKLLIISGNITERDFRGRLEQLRDDFADVIIDERHIHPVCTIGYVYGEPDSGDTASEIIRHADVRLTESVSNGIGSILGYEFDKSQKRQTDILSEVSVKPSGTSVDEVTGLSNMQFFRLRADELLSNVLDINRKPVVLYFNIGNFRAYNEEYGFRKGDKLLRDIADVLTDQFSGKLISRFAEDHFVILTYGENIEGLLDSTLEKVKPLFGNLQMYFKAGIAECESGEYIGVTCDKAKLACDSIKHAYGTDYTYYTEKLEARNRLEQYVITHVDEAAENGYLRVYYQPIVDIQSGRIIELEALARWIDPVHGFLAPGDFIPALEESKLIHKIDMFIARQVCKDQRLLGEIAGFSVPVSINLSRLDFMLMDTVGYIDSLVQEYDVDIKNLHIEITESALEYNSEELKNKIREFKDKGYEVWLDDFGSGYSSLNSLQEFNFDVVKVDMRFMRTLGTNPQTKIIVNSIIEMTKNLGLRSLVEGVETEYQYEYIREIGVDMAQGFLFSRPVPIDELKF